MTRLRLAIARECSFACHCAASVAHARVLLARERPAALVLEPEDATGEATAPLAREWRARAASGPVIVVVRRTAGWTRNALALLAVQPELVVMEEEMDVIGVTRVIAPPAPDADLLADVWPRLERDVPLALRPVVRFALARAAAPLPVTGFALALGLHRKTLWLQCRREGVSSVQALMMWCRLIAVSHALRTRAQSVEWIANEMEFPSPTALRNVTRRYLGVTPTEIRAAGGERLACLGFTRWLRGSAESMATARVEQGVTRGDAA